MIKDEQYAADKAIDFAGKVLKIFFHYLLQHHQVTNPNIQTITRDNRFVALIHNFDS